MSILVRFEQFCVYPNPWKKRRDSCAIMFPNVVQSNPESRVWITKNDGIELFSNVVHVLWSEKRRENFSYLIVLGILAFSQFLDSWLTTTYHNTRLTFKSKSAYRALTPVAKTTPYKACNNFKRRVLVWFRHPLDAFLPPASPISVIASGKWTAFNWLELTHYITTFHWDIKRADVWLF